MRKWQALTGERLELYGHVGLRLIDEFTGASPLGRINALLEVGDVGRGWRATEIKPIRTPSGVLAYAGLERRVQVAGQQPRRYRIQLEAELYRPFYRIMVSEPPDPGPPFYHATVDGVEFDAYPYNDADQPAFWSRAARAIHLAPAANYPFPAHIRILRGRVVAEVNGIESPIADAEVRRMVPPDGTPVADVEVNLANKERVLTDERGEFALPLRWAPLKGEITVDAFDYLANRKGEKKVMLPDDLGKSHTIKIA
jgi:hypothetical protein